MKIEEIANYNVAGFENKHSPWIFHEGIIEGIVNAELTTCPFLKCCMRLIATRVNDVTN